MKLSSKLYVVFFLLSNTCLIAQVKFVNEFLNIGVGARALSMSGSVTASSSDASATYWNPANLSGINAPMEFNAMHANWFGGIANYDYLALAKRVNQEKNGYFGLSMIRLGIDNIPNTLNLVGPDGSIDFDRVTTFSAADYGFFLSYGQEIKSNFKAGGNVKVIHRTIGTFGASWGFGADLGVTLVAGHFTFSAMARDITTTFNTWSFNLSEEEKKVFLATGNDVPLSSTELTLPRIIFGTAYKFDKGNFSGLAEVDLNISTDGRRAAIISGNRFTIDPTFGFEIGYAKRVYLRGGIGNLQRIINLQNANSNTFDFQPNVGLGLGLGRLRIDYALANVGNVSGVLASHIFSASLRFAEKNKNNN